SARYCSEEPRLARSDVPRVPLAVDGELHSGLGHRSPRGQGRRNIRSTGLSIRQRELLRSAGKVSLHNAAALLREAEFAVRLVEWTTIRSASRQLLDAGNDIVLIERTDREWLSDLSRHHQSAFRRRLAHKHEPVGWRNQESATGS